MYVSKSECNIVHENLSQDNSSDIRTNVITELKYNEHIEPSVIDKGSSYFNIFECGRNLLDQLDPLSTTEGSICSSSFNYVITLVGSSDKLFCDKVSWTMLHSDSLMSIDRFSDKVSCTMISLHSSTSVTLTFDEGAVSSA